MNYHIDNLNDDEILSICKSISAGEIKKIFVQNPKSFNKLMPGFRPDKLNDEQVYSFILKHKDKNFVKYLFQDKINLLLKDFQEQQRILEEGGIPEEDAFIATLASSPLLINPELYFRFNGKECSEEQIKAIEYSLELFRINQRHIKGLKELEERHKTSLEEARKIITSSEQKIQELKTMREQYIETSNKYSQLEDSLWGIIQTQEKIIAELEEELNSQPTQQETAGYFVEGAAIDGSDIETNSKWQDVIDTLELELSEAGVTRELTVTLAYFLYSAFINNTPLLLVGPNGAEIAEALSLSLFGKYPGVLHCEGKFSRHILEQCTASKSEVILIDNPLHHEWHNNIIAMLSRREKFYIAVHPFAEDLKIEPASIMNYCMPVLTDIFVDRYPTRKYAGGNMSKSFKPFTPKDETGKYHDEFMLRLRVSPHARNIITRVLSCVHDMDSGNDDGDFMFVFYPAAYMSGRLEALKEYMKGSQLSDKVSRLLEYVTGNDE